MAPVAERPISGEWPPRSRRWRCAIHEAGHAAVIVGLGGTFASITALGYTSFDPESAAEIRQDYVAMYGNVLRFGSDGAGADPFTEVRIALGGIAAEWEASTRATGKPPRSRAGWSADREDAAYWAGQLPRDQGDAVREATEHARRIVRASWAGVQALARALMLTRVVPGTEAIALLQSACAAEAPK